MYFYPNLNTALKIFIILPLTLVTRMSFFYGLKLARAFVIDNFLSLDSTWGNFEKALTASQVGPFLSYEDFVTTNAKNATMGDTMVYVVSKRCFCRQVIYSRLVPQCYYYALNLRLSNTGCACWDEKGCTHHQIFINYLCWWLCNSIIRGQRLYFHWNWVGLFDSQGIKVVTIELWETRMDTQYLTLPLPACCRGKNYTNLK